MTRVPVLRDFDFSPNNSEFSEQYVVVNAHIYPSYNAVGATLAVARRRKHSYTYRYRA